MLHGILVGASEWALFTRIDASIAEAFREAGCGRSGGCCRGPFRSGWRRPAGVAQKLPRDMRPVPFHRFSGDFACKEGGRNGRRQRRTGRLGAAALLDCGAASGVAAACRRGNGIRLAESGHSVKKSPRF